MVYPKLQDLLNRIHEELIRPCQTSHRTVGTSTQAPSNPDPGRGPSPPHPWQQPDDPYGISQREVPPLGRRDLDPFLGPGPGGGNIVDPLRDLRNPRFPGQPPLGPDGIPLPRGAVPPGARFDPFLPEGIVRPDIGHNPDLDPFPPYPGRPPMPRGGGPFDGFGGGPFRRGGNPFGGGGGGGII